MWGNTQTNIMAFCDAGSVGAGAAVGADDIGVAVCDNGDDGWR